LKGLRIDVLQPVRDAQQRFWDALRNKDAALFERVLAEDFVPRSAGQPHQTRAGFIATLTSFPAVVLSIGSDDLEVHPLGDLAVITGIQVARLRLPNGIEVIDKLAITNLFRHTPNQWQMVLSHAVSLPAEG
jgi:ketosteroid isomerase-like protein